MYRMFKSAREIAKEQGHVTYTAVNSCKRGHDPIRYVSNGVCVECSSLYSKTEGAVAKRKILNREYKQNNKDKVRHLNKLSRERTKDRVKARGALYYSNNKDKIKAKNKKHYEENKGSYFVRSKLRAKALKHAGFNHEKAAINRFYKERPEGYHVDHIIPINHPLVCGLHCIANLQYLTAEENLKKGNSFSNE